MNFTAAIKNNHVSAYSAQTAYFIIMSVFPFILILLSIIRFTPLKEEMLLEMVSDLLPPVFYPIISGIVTELYIRANAVLSISVVLALWSSAKFVLAMTNALNIIYDVDETRSYLLLRLRSAAYTAAFVIAIIVSRVLMVFGEKINAFVGNNFPIVASAFQYILNLRIIMLFIYQTFIFCLMYKFLPNRKSKFYTQIPGAVFTSLGWNIFSYLFGIYITYGKMSYTYGSLTTLVIVMIWLYFCIYMLFAGASLNKFLEQKIIRFLKKRKHKKS